MGMTLWYKGVFAKRHDRSDKTVVVDFDGTICEDNKFPGFGKPMPGVKEALDRLKEAGLDIVILSCRFDPNSPKMMEEQKRKMAEWLDEHEIPYTRIDEGTEGKVQGLCYVDNKALHYEGGNDWERICKEILSLR
jgi:2-hydroxy-3-keto-5-methylthiopentenyl-1-phosphate phosphatase